MEEIRKISRRDGKAKPKKELVAVGAITLMMAFMEITGLPGRWFPSTQIADIQPVYLSLLLNFTIAGLLCFIGMRIFCPDWPLGMSVRGYWPGLKHYGVIGFVAVIATFISLHISLQPFTATPTLGKVFVEGFIYYIALSIIEEVYLRGLLLNLIEKLLCSSKNTTLWAVLISSVLFGLGHIFGEIGKAPLLIISKVVWTICLGIYLGATYKKSGSLWVPITLHTLINIAAVPFLFSTSEDFPFIALITFLTAYVILGGYGIYILIKPRVESANKGGVCQ